MKQGICLLALNHPYYGNYAAQLTASIKFTAPDINITLLHDDRAITHIKGNNRIKVFNNLVTVPIECHTNKNRNDFLKAKSFVYNLSPYDETIFIDADVLWLPRKPITKLFDELKNVQFTCPNRGFTELAIAKNGFITWCDPQQIREKYSVDGILYNISSEFFYFKKCKEVKKLFIQWQKNYADLKVKYMLFGNDIPDELPLTIATLQTGIYPHTSPYLPFYWEQFQHENIKPAELYTTYYAYSCGGAIQDKKAIDFYNNLAQFYCNKFGFGQYFPMQSKRRWLPERVNI